LRRRRRVGSTVSGWRWARSVAAVVVVARRTPVDPSRPTRSLPASTTSTSLTPRSASSLLLLLLLSLLLLLPSGDGARRNVQPSIDVGRDGLDLSPELLLDPVEVESIFVGEEVDGDTEVTESTGSTYSVEVGLGGFGEVEVDDDVDGLDIDTSCQEI
jgi:hypothetical protein